MPVYQIKKQGKLYGFQWGHHGKIYEIARYGVKKAKELSEQQARAIYASGYRGK